jgi:fatty-acid desaturase
LAILPASAWLIVCRLIPGLRRRVGVSYCIAAVLVLLSCLFSRSGLTLVGLAAGTIAGILLGVRWRRALMHRSLEINTIINYHNSDGL